MPPRSARRPMPRSTLIRRLGKSPSPPPRASPARSACWPAYAGHGRQRCARQLQHEGVHGDGDQHSAVGADRIDRRSIEQHWHVRRQRLHHDQYAETQRDRRHRRHGASSSSTESSSPPAPKPPPVRANLPPRCQQASWPSASNSITATVTTTGGTSADSDGDDVIYAPSYAGAYVVPGAPGTTQHLNIGWFARKPSTTTSLGTSS